MITWIKNLTERIRAYIRYRKRLKGMKKRDPYVYK